MRILSKLVLVICLILPVSKGLSQSSSISIDNDRKFWLGINFGGIWQNSDVRSILSGASGLTFDYYLIRNGQSTFGLGVRGQYLAATSEGLGVTQDFAIQNNSSLNGFAGNPDYASLPSPDNYVYQNHSTEMSDLSGNLIISLNRLRATTGLHLYLFGGLGGTGYKTSMDQLDVAGSPYNYNAVNPSMEKSVIEEELRNLRDGSFETFGEDGSKRTWVLTPTVGAGFGIQLSPRIQIGLEHKVGFTSTDLLDGNQWNSSGQLDGKNDIYHYSSFTFHIGIGKLTGGGEKAYRNDLPPTVSPPTIDVLEPSTSLYTSQECTADIRARITNISGKDNITLRRGQEIMSSSEYSWDSNMGMLEIHEPLKISTITYSIDAKNAGGSSSRLLIISCGSDQIEEHLVVPPTITITNPATKEYETQDCSAQILASITNIRSQEQLVVSENNRVLSTSEYSWNPNTRALRINKEVLASSQFIISAKNEAGSDIQEVRITCIQNVPSDPSLKPPVLNVVIPSSHPYTSANCVAKLTIRSQNISNKNQITVFENGQKLSPVLYTFNGESGLISLTRGLPGETDYYVKAENAAGTSSVTQSFVCPRQIEVSYITICHFSPNDRSNPQTISIPTIDWPKHMAHGDIQGTCPVIEEPQIIINNPSSSPATVEDCRASLSATVLNIEYKEDIEVLQNGVSIPFNFQGNNVSINNISFTGTASFTIMVTNLQGTVTKTVTFVCQPPQVRMITICHSEKGSIPQTISIPATEWVSHQSHGDTQGNCPIVERPVLTILSPGTQTVTLNNCMASIRASVKNVSGKSDIFVTKGGIPVPFDFSNNLITISDIPFTNTATFLITVKNSAGSSVKKVSFICKPEIEMITICHKENGIPSQTISIPAAEWLDHSSHGDVKGVCPVIAMPEVKIISPESSPQIMENCQANIRASVINVADKQSITVTENNSPVDFNFDGNFVIISNYIFTGSSNFTITAINNAGSSKQSVSFVCKPPVEVITICHKVTGADSQTLTVPITQWQAHASHGDTQGSCPVILPPVVSITSPTNTSVSVVDCKVSLIASIQNISGKEDIIVSQNGVPIDFMFSSGTVSITGFSFVGTANISVTATNSAGSSIKTTTFICNPPVEIITICHNEAGEEPRTISIPENEWTSHAAHGDSRGLCPVVEIPNVSISSPLAPQVIVENCLATIRATVENVANREDITVTNNNSPVPFEFSGNSLSVSNIAFQGTAIFRITGTNIAGSSSKTVTFICQPPVEIISICHKDQQGILETRNIPLTEWSAHQAHGDTRGECPVINEPVLRIVTPVRSPFILEDCSIILEAIVENISGSQDITVTKDGVPVNYTFSENAIRVSNISFTGTANLLVAVTNASGVASQTVTFICQPPVEIITICHLSSGEVPVTLKIPVDEWPTHEEHGDTKGECPEIEPPLVTIVVPATANTTLSDCRANIAATVKNINNKTGITVTQNGNPVAFDYSGNSISVSNQDFIGTALFEITATNIAGKSSKTVTFICQQEDKKITICHYPPGNPDNPQQIEIPESAWPAHETHGDLKGGCPVLDSPELTINTPNSTQTIVKDCKASISGTVKNVIDKSNISVTLGGIPVPFDFSGNSFRISNYLFEGIVEFVITISNATGSVSSTIEFVCQPEETEEQEESPSDNEDKITICHYPPGNKSNPQTISIPESAWPAHEKHGDSRGPCNNE